MHILTNTIQNYPWGSRSALSDLLGRERTAEPEAELWMGAHPSAPSRLRRDGVELTLEELIAAEPQGALGPACVEAFGDRLPFLLKVLAADRPLSIQVHPDAASAREGFQRDVGRGLHLEDARRTYKDPNHKPELIFALGEFAALCGFRALPDTLALLDELAVPGLEELAGRLCRRGVQALEAVVRGFFETSAAEREAQIGALAARCPRLDPAGRFSSEAAWLPRLAAAHPDDPGVLTALLMNHVRLRPGQAMFLPPRTVHAYLAGIGIEIMASSDNVVRGGLTTKHVDVGELLRLTDFTPAAAAAVVGCREGDYEEAFPVPAPEIRLSRVSLEAGALWRGSRRGPEILLCIEGSTAASTRSGAQTLARGDSAFVPFGDGVIELSGGPAVVFRAAVGL